MAITQFPKGPIPFHKRHATGHFLKSAPKSPAQAQGSKSAK